MPDIDNEVQTEVACPSNPDALSHLRAAVEATARADWHAVKQAAADCLRCMPAVASNPDVSVKVLVLQAEAQHRLRQSQEALKALDLALQLKPSCAEALWLRAAVHAAAEHHMASFMDLRNLSQLQPTYPGLTEALQQAARAVSQQQAAQATAKAPPRKTYIRPTRRAAGSNPHAAQCDAVQQGAYAVLGLQHGVDVQAVRQAYKQLAARFHPDKWVLATAQQQANAEEQFKRVAAAYQSIMEAAQQ